MMPNLPAVTAGSRSPKLRWGWPGLHRADRAAGVTGPGPGHAALVGARADRNARDGGALGDHIVSRAARGGQPGLRGAAVAGEVPEERVLVHAVVHGGEAAGLTGLVAGQV